MSTNHNLLEEKGEPKRNRAEPPLCFKPPHKPSCRPPLVMPPDNSGKGSGLRMGLWYCYCASFRVEYTLWLKYQMRHKPTLFCSYALMSSDSNNNKKNTSIVQILTERNKADKVIVQFLRISTQRELISARKTSHKLSDLLRFLRFHSSLRLPFGFPLIQDATTMIRCLFNIQ